MTTTTLAPRTVEEEVRALRDEQQVIDALYRFAAGQDRKDRTLFLSAFASDATLDFTQPAALLGVEQRPLHGHAWIGRIMDRLAVMDTMHMVTNPRVRVRGNRATLAALVEAQHVSREDPDHYLLLKNIYDVELARTGDDWHITSMVIRNVWRDGDARVLFEHAPAPGRMA